MDLSAVDQLAESFASFYAPFAPLFGRVDTQYRSAQYVYGLLVQHAERRNAENLAAAVGATPRALQRLLTESPWEHRQVIDTLQAFLGPHLSADDGVWVLQEIGFAKRGTKSVGVARQYSRSLGKKGNCQIGIFLTYASARGEALVDMRLFLPRIWADNLRRREAAGIPNTVMYQSPMDLGLAMLQAARARAHLQSQWVIGSEGLGSEESLRAALAGAGWWYMLRISGLRQVVMAPTAAEVPVGTRRAKKRRRRSRVAAAPGAQRVAELADSLPSATWRRLTVADRDQALHTYQYATLRICECRGWGLGQECWLVLRRNVDGSGLAAFLSNAPATIPPDTLARVSMTRASTAADRAQQDAIGLAEYEVRSWLGWHHHMALSLLAGAFLIAHQQRLGRVGSRLLLG